MEKTKRLLSRSRLGETVDPRRGDVALLICCFITGMVDAVTFNNWEVFAGMQTGMACATEL
ncbi:hypothetical protein BDY21DRAFT_330744 [Lineolata rhizophorae]|uniref:Uncharacterized protein n=1 Tax=Lineolata rhizophorae TaxID=578093 RepID=A0A6A6PE13_9PEZI|nr:hypothetical protein BDY21DRAFT_330744 [Lineolata rhizophorae]